MNPLPIDVVPGTHPPHFKWQQTVVMPFDQGERKVYNDGPLPPGADVAIAQVIQMAKELAAFKEWVHNYLDAKGVPKSPDGPHSAQGCRIGDRMDYVFAELEALRRQVQEHAEPYGPRQLTTEPPKKGRGK